MKKLFSLLSALALTASPITAFAQAANTIDQNTVPPMRETQITTEIAPAYIVTIPSDTKVTFGDTQTSFGKIELTEGLLDPGKAVRIHLDSDYTLKNKADNSKTIPYDIISTDNVGTTESMKKYDALLKFESDFCPLTIAITEDDWDSAYAGGYSDTVTFTVFYGDLPEEQGGQ